MDASLAIIVPLYNKVELTQACLDSLIHTGIPENCEVILVDNGSTDGTASWGAALTHERVRFIRSETNLDFAGGCHVGVEATDASRLLFLNNDTEVTESWLDFTQHLDRPSVGAVGCTLVYPNRTVQHAGVAFASDSIGFHVLAGVPVDDARLPKLRAVQAVTAACMALRRDVWEHTGGFDRAYRNGAEDVDLCLRIRQLGLDILYDPCSVVVHHESQSDGRFQWARENILRYLGAWKNRVIPDQNTFVAPESSVLQLSDEVTHIQHAPSDARSVAAVVNGAIVAQQPRQLILGDIEACDAGFRGALRSAPEHVHVQMDGSLVRAVAIPGASLEACGGADPRLESLEAIAIDLAHRARLWGAETGVFPLGAGAFPISIECSQSDTTILNARWGTVPSESRMIAEYQPFVTEYVELGHLDFAHREHIVVVPVEGDVASQERLESAFRRWATDSATTVVIRTDAGDGGSMDVVERAADSVGDEHLPDVVVLPSGAAADATLIAQADLVVCVGRHAPLLASIARAVNTPAVSRL